MKPLALTNLNPASIDARELVNREDDARWLRDNLGIYLGSEDPRLGGAFCILGEKGIGKSILTRKVLDELELVHAATTVFVTVDCRPLRNQRDVYRKLVDELVHQLAYRSSVSDPIKAELRAFGELARFDEVTLQNAHERLVQHKIGLDVSGARTFLKWLEVEFNISLSRNKKTIESLQGKLVFDGPRLQDGLIQLIDDLHEHAKLRVVVFLDNLEELDHEAMRDEARRERMRGEIESLLNLAEGPLGLVLNMRTYYASVLPRRISKRRTLERLGVPELHAILDKRLEKERQDKREAVAADRAVQSSIAKLAKLARTPLAFLTWTEYVLEEGLYDQEDVAKALTGWFANHYSIVARHIPKVAALFEDAQSTVELEAVRDACAKQDAIVRQLLDHQVLLPVNYWDPRDFFLDPELGFLIGRPDLLEASR